VTDRDLPASGSDGPSAGPPFGDGVAAPAVGRASRWIAADGRELWRLPVGAEAIATRLHDLGRAGVGGFEDAGIDTAGPWLVRADLSHDLEAWWSLADAPAWRSCIVIFSAIADALAHAEARNIFPGALHPKAVWVERGGVAAGLRADPLVRGLLGDPTHAGGSGGGLSRWIAPDQARGAPWDNAANRYVFGLLLYRALAGRHPFRDKGLRHELAEQESRGAPPMPEEVAAALPPGLQSFCLRLLDPDPRARPARASEIATRLRGFADAPDVHERPIATRPAVRSGMTQRVPKRSSSPRAASDPSPTRRRLARLVAALVPLAAGLGLAWSLSPNAAEPIAPLRANVGASASLRADETRADDCASCHPEQTAQWHASVMAHSVKSPLFQGLEMLIEEQVGRDFDCPGGAGVLRESDGRNACVDPQTGLPITGSGGALWCVNCHSPGNNLQEAVPPWDGRSRSNLSRKPLRDLLPASSMEGISCAFCHQTHGPVQPGNARVGRYEGNAEWFSTQTGQRFAFRPEDARGVSGIGNSGYELDPKEFVASLAQDGSRLVDGAAHVRPTEDAADYLRSSQFCGACHDVRLFGTDAIEGVRKGEHFKRLRNAYSEWVDWAALERAAGREPASCQDCHMSLYPGVCVPEGSEGGALAEAFSRTQVTALSRGCPPGTVFSDRAPGSRPQGAEAANSNPSSISTHYLTGVDVPLSPEFPEAMIDDLALDAHGVPRGAKQRRDLLLGKSFRFELGSATRGGGRLEIPIEITNVGAGHKIPAGFSQEREFWVHLRVTDDAGRVLYEVGRIDRTDEDLRDKIFVRVNVDDTLVDAQGRPQGVFGADVVDGPDLPQWEGRANNFRGRGLINLQNGFLRCVTCIGERDVLGRCVPGPGQGRHRADRFADGAYDPDTGECISNLGDEDKFLEIYFPVGALDSTRGTLKGPDAIIDTRSAPPGVPMRWVYELTDGVGPITIEARLMFRAFPPFLVAAFADYEAQQDRRGLRPSGPLVTRDMLERLEVVEIARAEVTIP
jgi:hypothetical protein